MVQSLLFISGVLLCWTCLVVPINSLGETGKLTSLFPSELLHAFCKGHNLVARIAAKLLSTKAAKRIHKLLPKNKDTLASVSKWADSVKTDPNYEYSKPFHNFKGEESFENPPTNCPNFIPRNICENCIFAAIDFFSDSLRGKPVDPFKLKIPPSNVPSESEALMFLVHFYGDFHNPLHCMCACELLMESVYLFTCLVTHKWRLGKKVFTIWKGRIVDLHEIWDLLLIEVYFSDFG